MMQSDTIRGSSAAAEAGVMPSPDSFHPAAERQRGLSSAAAPAPREGLPPCLTVALFENRIATMVDADADCPHEHYPERFHIGVGNIIDRDDKPSTSHGIRLWNVIPVLEVRTDDPAEAAAAYERGERWIRTGVLDD